MKKIILCMMIPFFFSCTEKKNNSVKLIEKFFSVYEEKGIDIALEDIFQSNDCLVKSSIDTIKIKLTNVTNLIGDYDGYEIIGKKSIGNSLINYVCLVKYDRQPLRFNFLLYKAKDKWVLQNFQFNSSTFMDDIIDLSKFYYIK